MPSRIMASTKGYQIIVYNDPEFDVAEAVEPFRKLFGYDVTQALSCAQLVKARGEEGYACKIITDPEVAKTVGDYLEEYGYKVKVVYFKKK